MISINLLSINPFQDYGLDDVISAVYTPSPLSSVVISEANPPPIPLDDDVICGCPLTGTGNYSDTSNNMKLVLGTLAIEGWAVTFGIARRRLGGAAARPSPSSLYQM